MRHSKVEPPSVELNVKVADAEPEGLDGFVSIVVFGGRAVDREGRARRRLDVAGDVGRAHAHGVAAVGREARGGEGVRPVAGRVGRAFQTSAPLENEPALQ